MSSASILVLGAGELGNAVINALTSHPNKPAANIAVLLRSSTLNSQDPQKQGQNKRLLSLGVALEAGDVEAASVAELAQIFGKYHTIVSCTGMYLAPGSQLKLTRAVLEAGVARYFPWQYGIDYDVVGGGSAQDLFDEQLEVRNLLRSSAASASSPVDWVIVSTGLFMSFLLVPEFGPVDLKNRVLRGLGNWDTPVSATTPQDIGRMVAEIVYDPRDVSRQVVYVAGDTVTYGRVADLVEARFGGSWTREIWDLDFLQKRLQAEPDNGMVKYQNVFAAGKGVAWDMSKTINRRRGIDLEDFETYLKHIDA
ncbi:hypothetical protein PFICI_11688 [Pestalotiopsis fici W106-1]|uniref:NmrA-like domain-containing protein n=1 Tax=Pestalotiopsis fici (strain W106-1 / CGMCC3.15140) TaxID=1229662 RepID=W3WTY9_PESFW|nr:uncharacterized protein PFICI_11688 [Pestalotiopsis fici W106-1]ETS76301.1 hypothetical protein PFICI_11688 [Pestalotiopsis fici W106-1]